MLRGHQNLSAVVLTSRGESSTVIGHEDEDVTFHDPDPHKTSLLLLRYLNRFSGL